MKEKLFYVQHAWKISCVDNYEEGEDPSSVKEYDFKEVEGFYNSVEELANKIGAPENLEHWYIIDDGWIGCSVAENELGEQPSDEENEQFKRGEINLYACEYNFRIKFIEGVYNPSMKELSMRFNMNEI